MELQTTPRFRNQSRNEYRGHAGLEPIPDWLYSDWLFELDPDPAKCHEIYSKHVAERIGSTEPIWDHLVGQVYLGSEVWIEKMRTLVESRPRSDESWSASFT